jgi:hypothetical protein
MPKRRRYDTISKRDADIIQLVLNGETYRAAGAKYAISPEWVRKIIFLTLTHRCRQFYLEHGKAIGVLRANRESLLPYLEQKRRARNPRVS